MALPLYWSDRRKLAASQIGAQALVAEEEARRRFVQDLHARQTGTGPYALPRLEYSLEWQEPTVPKLDPWQVTGVENLAKEIQARIDLAAQSDFTSPTAKEEHAKWVQNAQAVRRKIGSVRPRALLPAMRQILDEHDQKFPSSMMKKLTPQENWRKNRILEERDDGTIIFQQPDGKIEHIKPDSGASALGGFNDPKQYQAVQEMLATKRAAEVEKSSGGKYVDPKSVYVSPGEVAQHFAEMQKIGDFMQKTRPLLEAAGYEVGDWDDQGRVQIKGGRSGYAKFYRPEDAQRLLDKEAPTFEETLAARGYQIVDGPDIYGRLRLRRGDSEQWYTPSELERLEEAGRAAPKPKATPGAKVQEKTGVETDTMAVKRPATPDDRVQPAPSPAPGGFSVLDADPEFQGAAIRHFPPGRNAQELSKVPPGGEYIAADGTVQRKAWAPQSDAEYQLVPEGHLYRDPVTGQVKRKKPRPKKPEQRLPFDFSAPTY